MQNDEIVYWLNIFSDSMFYQEHKVSWTTVQTNEIGKKVKENLSGVFCKMCLIHKVFFS